MFEKKVLRRIFGPKKAEGTRGKTKLHKEQIRNFHTGPLNIGYTAQSPPK
jgi:hypothetical protein